MVQRMEIHGPLPGPTPPPKKKGRKQEKKAPFDWVFFLGGDVAKRCDMMIFRLLFVFACVFLNWFSDVGRGKEGDL